MSIAGGAVPRSCAILGNSDRTGRLGVSYMRTLCAQAGLGCTETSPGEDHLAIDLMVSYSCGDIRVQIKTGTASPIADGSISLPVKQDWIDKWKRNHLPAYLVYVRLPSDDYGSLVEHVTDATTVHAHAYWARVDSLSQSPVRLLPSKRLTMDTFMEWEDDILASYSGGRSGTHD